MKFIPCFLLVIFILSCSQNSTDPQAELNAPSNFIITQIDDLSLQLTWQDNNEDEEGFQLSRKIDEEEWQTEYQILAENSTAFIDSELTEFGLYIYRLSAFLDDEYSDFCEAEITLLDFDSLTAPSNLTLQQLDAVSIQLNWQDNSSAEQGFRIDRKIGDNDWEIEYQSLAENTTAFIDSTLNINGSYHYRVCAFSNDSISEFTENSIYFLHNDIAAIVPLFSGQISLSTGSSYDYVVALLDSDGNLVCGEFDVWFRFMACPEGTNLNNQLFGTADSLCVQADMGQAVVTINAGLAVGPIALKSYAYNSVGNEISCIKSNMIIHGGIPANVIITIGGINSGLNLGGGNWQIQVSAIITDVYGNPVDYGTAVWFYLDDPNDPGTDPEWASIQAAAYVGNENMQGNSIDGVAFTTLVYEGAHTNDALVIWAEVSGIVALADSALVYLPLQFGNMFIIATPWHVDWNQQTNFQDSLATTIRVQVLDGQYTPINNQQIHFTSSHGMPVPSEPGGDPFTGITGYVNGQNGMHYKVFFFQKYECAPPIPNPPGTTMVTIEANILGTGIWEATTVVLNRYID